MAKSLKVLPPRRRKIGRRPDFLSKAADEQFICADEVSNRANEPFNRTDEKPVAADQRLIAPVFQAFAMPAGAMPELKVIKNLDNSLEFQWKKADFDMLEPQVGRGTVAAGGQKH